MFVDNYHEPISLQETPLLPEWTICLPHALSNWIGMYIHVTQCHARPIYILSNIPCFGTFPFLLLINWSNLWYGLAQDRPWPFQNHCDMHYIHLLFINHFYGLTRSILLPIFFKILILHQILRPFGAHFLRGGWTLWLPMRNLSLVFRGFSLAFSTVASWEWTEQSLFLLASELLIGICYLTLFYMVAQARLLSSTRP